MWVFSANTFPQFVTASRIYSAPISYRRGPRHCEDALVLYRKLELQSLPFVVGVNVDSSRNRREAEILVGDALQRVLRGAVTKQLITFNDMQTLGVWRAVQIEHGKGPVGLDPHRVYHQRSALVVAYRIPIPGP